MRGRPRTVATGTLTFLLAFGALGCAGRTAAPGPPAPPAAPAAAPGALSARADVPADSLAPADALRDWTTRCAAPAAQLWGGDLCGALLLVDQASRAVIATAGDSAGALTMAGDVWTGSLPAGIPLANTSLHWGGRDWAMVVLPLPTDAFARTALLAHESFHREQPRLGLPARDAAAPYLDARDGRTLLRLELRAWAAALRAPDRATADARARDALAFRATRQARYPDAAALEAAMERHEGLAEYTGVRVALAATGAPLARVAADLDAFERRPSYVRAFAYATGPALGLTLDRVAPGWPARVREIPDLSRAVADALGAAPRALTDDELRARGAPYGWDAVAAAESARDSVRLARDARLRAALVDGPTLVIRANGFQMTFDPNTLVPLGAAGTVYPSATFSGAWGRVVIDGGSGALVAPDFQSLRLAAPADPAARPLRGAGWMLELAPGWTVRPAAGGDGLEVVRGGEPRSEPARDADGQPPSVAAGRGA